MWMYIKGMTICYSDDVWNVINIEKIFWKTLMGLKQLLWTHYNHINKILSVNDICSVIYSPYVFEYHAAPPTMRCIHLHTYIYIYFTNMFIICIRICVVTYIHIVLHYRGHIILYGYVYMCYELQEHSNDYWWLFYTVKIFWWRR